MKVFLTKINESWIVDRVRRIYKNNKEIVTNSIKSRHSLIIAPWMWDKLDFKKIKNKKIICNLPPYKKAWKEEVNRFNEYDQFVDEYHTISIKSKEQIERLQISQLIRYPFG